MPKQRKYPSDSRPKISAKAGAFLFMSPVPLAGYVLRDDVELAPTLGAEEERDSGPAPWIMERQPVGTLREVKHVAPLAREGLHRDFARLVGRDDARLVSFANEYGLLGRGEALLLLGEGPRPVYYGETLTRWRQECQRLRLLLDLWDDARGAANHGQAVDADLAGRIVWHEGPPRRVDLVLPNREAVIAMESAPGFNAAGFNAEAIAGWTSRDLAAPARFWVCEQVNKALYGHASPAVLPLMGGDLAIVPHTLLAALYVLFANELSGRARDLRRCEYCGRHFYPGRSDQVFCGASCRKMHHYHETKGGPS